MPVTEIHFPTMSSLPSSITDESNSDAQLLRRYFANRDQEAMDELFKRHSGMAYRLAFAAVENAADAEEIVQMAFLQVLLKSGKNEIYNVRGWIMRMVVDTCHDKMKEEARRRRREKDAKGDRASVPGLDDEKAELVTAAVGAVKALPKSYRLPVWLHYLEGLSFDEVGCALSLPEATARSQANRGIEQVRQSLAAAGFASAVALPSLLASAPLASAPVALTESFKALIATKALGGGSVAAGAAPAKGLAAFASTKLVVAGVVLAASAAVAGIKYHGGGAPDPKQDEPPPMPVKTVNAADGDWPQFRGPNRDGVAVESPKLADTWPANGPAMLWHSEWSDRPSDEGRMALDSGCSGPIVAGGNVFVYVNIKAPKDGGKKYKPLSREVLMDAGWLPDLPDDLAKKFEDARVARPGNKTGAPYWFAITPPADAEIDAFLAKTPELDKYIKDFIATLDPGDAKKYGAYIKRRFSMFYSEFTWAELVRLSKMQDIEVESLNGLGEGRDSVLGYYRNPGNATNHGTFCLSAIVRCSTVTDTVVCMDAVTGKTVWKKDFPVDSAVFDRKDISLCGSPSGGFDWLGVSSVPVVSQGKLYAQGFMGIYCLSTKDGSLVWKTQTDPQHSSPLVAAGVVYNCGVAYDAENGKVLWKNPNFKQSRNGGSYGCSWGSPVLWVSGGTNVVITDDGQKMCALDMKTGNMVWTSDFRAHSYGPVISGDVLIGCAGQVQAAKLTPTGLQPLWSRKDVSAFGPLVYQGRVYCYGNIQGKHDYRWWCLDLKTGQDIWTKDVTWGQDVTSTPALADGKIITPCGSSHYNWSGVETLEMLKAGPEGYVQLALINKWKPKVVVMSSPAVAYGHLFFRLQDGGVGCWDLRAK